MTDSWFRHSYARRTDGLDKMAGGHGIGSDTFETRSDIIRYLNAILSPREKNLHIFVSGRRKIETFG